MSGATRIDSIGIAESDRRASRSKRLPIFGRRTILRTINVAWASIGEADIDANELVFNEDDDDLVFRTGDEIKRYSGDASRTL